MERPLFKKNKSCPLCVRLPSKEGRLRISPDTAGFVQVTESWYNYKDEIYPKEGEKQSYAKSTNATTYKWGDDGGGLYRAEIGRASCRERV